MDPALAGLIGVLVGTGATVIGVIVQARVSGQEIRARYRLAAIEKRLEVHQEAYSRWIEIQWSLHDAKIGNLVIEAQDWWTKNCLYLDPESRDAFWKALINAHSVRAITDSEERKLVMGEIRRAGDLIMEGVSLPPVGEIAENRINS